MFQVQKQSVISIGAPSIPRTNPDFYPATVANYKLGGSFNGILNLVLREEKGFTYGARSNFNGAKNYGSFIASSRVRSIQPLSPLQFSRRRWKNTVKTCRRSISILQNLPC